MKAEPSGREEGKSALYKYVGTADIIEYSCEETCTGNSTKTIILTELLSPTSTSTQFKCIFSYQ